MSKLFTLASLKHCSVIELDNEGNIAVTLKESPDFNRAKVEITLKAIAGNYQNGQIAEELAKEYVGACLRVYAAECLAFAFESFTRKNLDAWFDRHCEAIGIPFRFTDSHSYGARAHGFKRLRTHVKYNHQDSCGWASSNVGEFGHWSKLADIRLAPVDSVSSAVEYFRKVQATILAAAEVIRLRDEAQAKIKAIEQEYEEARKTLAPVFVQGFSVNR